MNFNKIRKIKLYVDQINKFKKLKSNINLSKNEFKTKMKPIFPSFISQYPVLFDNIIEGKDMNILNIMFKKLNDIEKEFESRKNELLDITPLIIQAKIFIEENKEMTKGKLQYLFSKLDVNFPISYKTFSSKYPKIVDRLLDKEFNSYNPSLLFFEQVKFSHEVYVGEVLAKKYIDPVVNKK